jgi:hypothetical protein
LKETKAIRVYNLDKQKEQQLLLKAKISDLAKERAHKSRELDEKYKKGNEQIV